MASENIVQIDDPHNLRPDEEGFEQRLFEFFQSGPAPLNADQMYEMEEKA